MLKFKDLIYLKILSIILKVFNNMSVPANVQNMFTKIPNYIERYSQIIVL